MTTVLPTELCLLEVHSTATVGAPAIWLVNFTLATGVRVALLYFAWFPLSWCLSENLREVMIQCFILMYIKFFLSLISPAPAVGGFHV